MKEKFQDINFHSATMKIIDYANTIIERYRAQGYDLSLRQLYYQFIATTRPDGSPWFPNSEASYKKLQANITNARLAGLIDWNVIKDRGREVNANPHWDSPAEIIRSAAYSFRIDTWEDQPNFVMVMVEKQALEGVLIPVCRDLDIQFTANKGYASASHLYEIAKQMATERKAGKEIHVIYLGDHDPSGIDMSRDVQDRLETYSYGSVNVSRVALNMSQIRQYNPPENPAKETDSRAAEYIRMYGVNSWELDALEPTVIANLVRTRAAQLRDTPLYDKKIAQQKKQREELEDIAAMYEQREEDANADNTEEDD